MSARLLAALIIAWAFAMVCIGFYHSTVKSNVCVQRGGTPFGEGINFQACVLWKEHRIDQNPERGR